MSRRLPAAAIVKGDRVRLGESDPEVTVQRIHNADPEPGRIRWETDAGDLIVGAATRVEVLHLAK